MRNLPLQLQLFTGFVQQTPQPLPLSSLLHLLPPASSGSLRRSCILRPSSTLRGSSTTLPLLSRLPVRRCEHSWCEHSQRCIACLVSRRKASSAAAAPEGCSWICCSRLIVLLAPLSVPPKAFSSAITVTFCNPKSKVTKICRILPEDLQSSTAIGGLG